MNTPKTEYSTEKTLYMAMELSHDKWKLGFSTGMGREPRLRNVEARDLLGLEEEIQKAREKFKAYGILKSCYEAGLDGFWIDRYLRAQGVENLVVDSSSIEVSRRQKQTKTDRLDATSLVRMLIRYHNGEDEVWQVGHVPSEEAEDRRHLHRYRKTTAIDYNRVRNRIWSLLRLQGVEIKINKDFLEQLGSARQWNGEPLPPDYVKRLEREYAHLQFLKGQLKEAAAERSERITNGESEAMQQVRKLMEIRGIGEKSAWLLVMEFFSWREFHNRREVGALAGLAPTPYQSGDSYREQGISKAGNRWVRALMVELSWAWLHYQPNCKIVCWYKEKYSKGGRNARKLGIVAMARKLLVALWRYLEYGEIPEGAELKQVSEHDS